VLEIAEHLGEVETKTIGDDLRKRRPVVLTLGNRASDRHHLPIRPNPHPAPPAPGSPAAGKPRAIFPYGVSRSYLEQSIRDLDLPVRVLGNLDGADLVLTLKNYYRRRPDSLRQAESSGVPIHILKSNSVTQVKEALTRVYGSDGQDGATTRALAETMDAIRKVKTTLQPLEISPQNAYVRRLQHQLVADNDLVARSTGKEPQRRLRILPAADVE